MTGNIVVKKRLGPILVHFVSESLLRYGVLVGVECLLPGEEIDDLRRVHLGELRNDSHGISVVPRRHLLSKAFELLFVLLPLSNAPGRCAVWFL